MIRPPPSDFPERNERACGEGNVINRRDSQRYFEHVPTHTQQNYLHAYNIYKTFRQLNGTHYISPIAIRFQLNAKSVFGGSNTYGYAHIV